MIKTGKPGLVIFYDHFYPAYKAGGPIQSLTNLAVALLDSHDIFVISSAFDLNETSVLNGTRPGEWMEVLLPASHRKINVWYTDSANPGLSKLKNLLAEINPAVIYINGIFSPGFVLLPLMAAKKYKVVLCPRGMLQKGALSGKALKKKIYLTALKWSGLCKGITWHATNEEEAEDTRSVFGSGVLVSILGNIPKKPVDKLNGGNKTSGRLRLVYLSLITAKKNLLQLLHIVAAMDTSVTLHVYGPVKDKGYWEKCEAVIKQYPGKIIYKADVQPAQVQRVFEEYDAAVLLTKGENFGHALYESLSSGRPVITSYFTPWNKLEEKNAGWNVDIADDNGIKKKLHNLSEMDSSDFDKFIQGAFDLATAYYKEGFNIENYRTLFSIKE